MNTTGLMPAYGIGPAHIEHSKPAKVLNEKQKNALREGIRLFADWEMDTLYLHCTPKNRSKTDRRYSVREFWLHSIRF